MRTIKDKEYVNTVMTVSKEHLPTRKKRFIGKLKQVCREIVISEASGTYVVCREIIFKIDEVSGAVYGSAKQTQLQVLLSFWCQNFGQS